MIFLLPIKNLVFWYYLSPWDSLSDTLIELGPPLVSIFQGLAGPEPA